MLITEKRAVFSLSLVYALRMMGLFMILPVFSLYADQFSDATPFLIGLAIGIYGLTQGLFQLPFGYMSDRFGRKKVIVVGLLIFCAGSLVAAGAESIHQIIVGRALQGLGAIAAAVMALAADLTREEIRTRVMAFIGMSIGLSFMLSMVLGPALAASYGLSSLFWITAVLALLGILVIVFITPNTANQTFHRDTQLSIRDVGQVVKNIELLKLNFGIFVLHLVLAATFVFFPLVLRDSLLIEQSLHWKMYLPVFLISVVFMVPMIIIAEKYRKTKTMFAIAVLLLICAEAGFAWGGGYLSAFVMLVLFFTGFNFLEASLPSLISRVAPADMKGTAMGLFSSGQFLGAFCGGLVGGLLLSSTNYANAFLALVAIIALWLVVVISMKAPQFLRSKIVSLKGLEQDSIARFLDRARELPGVQEVSVYIDDQVAYLKVEKSFDDKNLDALLVRQA